MRKSFLGYLLLSLLVLASCQKEVSFETDNGNNPGGGNTPGGGNNPGGSSGELLVKAVKTGVGTNITEEYFYDNNKKLIEIKKTGSASGLDQTGYIKIERNSVGIITGLKRRTAYELQLGGSELTYRLQYDEVKQRYTYSVFFGSSSFGVTYDSTVYKYNGAGTLIGADSYLAVDFSNGADPLDYSPSGKFEYAFDAKGNLIKDRQLQDLGNGTYEELTAFEYGYDDKVNPLQMPAVEALVTFLNPGQNNMTRTKYTITQPGSAPVDVVFSYSYTYNSAGKPSKMTGSNGESAVFTYQ